MKTRSVGPTEIPPMLKLAMEFGEIFPLGRIDKSGRVGLNTNPTQGATKIPPMKTEDMIEMVFFPQKIISQFTIRPFLVKDYHLRR